ncbi:hypothetical protein BDL97_09G087500 [Sphagnum fallax]|jgi:membrane-associated phospholipid phosphatase|nr:hypothetical protein BDL97_09G087500 [Sphagnum fallax]
MGRKFQKAGGHMHSEGLKQSQQTEDSVSEITSYPAQIPSTSNLSPDAATSFLQQVLEYDQQISRHVYQQCLGSFSYPFVRFCEVSGDGLFWIPATALIWLFPTALTPETRAFVFNLFIAFIIDLIVVGAIKGTVKRSRPVHNKGHVVIVAMDHWSFPSGHSTRVVMIATLCWLNIGLWKDEFEQVWLPHLLKPLRHSRLPALHKFPLMIDEDYDGVWTFALMILSTWALATAISRIVLGRHYVLDVAAGVILGYLEGVFLHFMLFVPIEVSESLHHWVVSKCYHPQKK